MIDVTAESVGRKTNFSVALAPNRQQSSSSLIMEASCNGYKAIQIAELRARQILLGEALPKEISSFFSTHIGSLPDRTMTIENGIFPNLWIELAAQPSLFLPKAWLWAAYCLKTC